MGNRQSTNGAKSSAGLSRKFVKPLEGNEPKDIKKKHYTYTNGDKYKGHYLDGVRNTQKSAQQKGVYTWKTFGAEYMGEWLDGKLHGSGQYVWPDGDSYDGEFVNDRIHGKGKFISIILGEEFDGIYTSTAVGANVESVDPLMGSLRNGRGWCRYNSPHECEGYEYEGDWLNSYWHGQGTLSREIPSGLGEKKFAMIDEYKGNFENGKISGKGVAKYREGENHPWKSYDGNWLNNQWHGEGLLKFQNLDEFDGTFAASQLVEGEYFYAATRNTYFGKFVEGLRHDDKAKFKFFATNDIVEIGKFVDDKLVEVKMTYGNGDTYVGPWHHDQNLPHGPNGKKVYNEEDKIYEGNFNLGNRDGRGTCKYGPKNPRSGQSYEGQWKGDAWNGKGILTYPEGDTYDGDFKICKKDGKGKFTYKSDKYFDGFNETISISEQSSEYWAEYNGEWKDDERHGRGRCNFGSPSTYYDGNWERNNRNGSGTFVCDSYQYTGSWSQNEFHGRGNLRYIPSDDEYDGMFDRGVFNGEGTFTYQTSTFFVGKYDASVDSKSAYYAKYVGKFELGHRHGRGTMFYGSDQIFYEGEWVCDIRAGSGKYYCPDFEYEGDWVNDVKEGKGKLSCEDHDYEGDWKEDKFNGEGKLTLKSSNEWYIGNFVDDLSHGSGKIYYNDGDLKFEGKFNRGKRISGKFYWGEHPFMEMHFGVQWNRSVYVGDWKDTLVHNWGNEMPDGQGKMIWKNSQGHTMTYDGEWKNGKCDGQGKLVIERNGCCDEVYEGPFMNGLFHGDKGYHSFPSKVDPMKADKYEGPFIKGLKHGRGSMYRAEDGSKHEGKWILNLEQAPGTWYFKSGAVLAGSHLQWAHETGYHVKGQGIVEYITGDSYIGGVKDTVKHGHGTLTLKNKKRFTYRWYEGDFSDDKFHGQGKIQYRKYLDEQTYEGGFHNGVRQGFGTIVYKNGDVYVGDSYNDKRHGKGKLTFGRGGWVDGDWKNDMLHGQVVYSHRDNFIYEGPYVEQRKDGAKAICKFADGSIYVGEVKRGKIHGTGTFTYADGKRVYVGEFKDGKEHGMGKFTDADGTVYEGQFVEGVMQGHGKIIYPNKTMYEGDWKEGFKHGDGVFKAPDGQVLEQGRYHNGIYQSRECCPPLQLPYCPPANALVNFTKLKMWMNQWSSTDPKIIEAQKKKKKSKKPLLARKRQNSTSLGAGPDMSGKAASSSKTAPVDDSTLQDTQNSAIHYSM